jgi:hypothetical protein
VRAVLAAEGVTRTLSAINGFNRRFVATKREGARRLATIHLISAAGRRWICASYRQQTPPKCWHELD